MTIASELTEEELAKLEDSQFEASTEATAGDDAKADKSAEMKLLDKMQSIAEQARIHPGRPRSLFDPMDAKAHVPRDPSAGEKGKGDTNWTDERMIIFTEYEDTKRYLVNMLRSAISGTELDEFRIEVFHGPTPPEKRDQIKKAFNKPPKEHPIRILIATDAAREGLNLQAHCRYLFHFDVPWNPSRLEQRNGRIDRKLSGFDEVFCNYFVYPQRPEDAVLKALVRKTKTIREELGSLSQVLEKRLADTMKGGIRRADALRMAKEIDDSSLDPEKQATTEEELEATRERQDALRENVALLERRVTDARKWISLDQGDLQDALSCSLELLGMSPLQSSDANKSKNLTSQSGSNFPISIVVLEATKLGHNARHTPSITGERR